MSGLEVGEAGEEDCSGVAGVAVGGHIGCVGERKGASFRGGG